MPGSAETIGRSLVTLMVVFACAALIRRWSRPLRALFIPTAVIGGFLILAAGPEVLGRLTGGTGIFSTETFAVWTALPGLLVNVMCASLLLGERLPSLKTIWGISGTHPLIEMAFAGGHGTLAGLSGVFVEYGATELLEVGLGLATVGMVAGIVVGTMLVNHAVRSPSISIARERPTSPDEDFDIDHRLPKPDDEPMDEWYGMAQVTAAAVFLGVSSAVAIVLLEISPFVVLAVASVGWSVFVTMVIGRRVLPAQLVRALDGRIRRIAGQRGDGIRDARHGRSAAQDRCRHRLQLSATHHTALYRWRLRHGAGRSPHRVVRASCIRDRHRDRDPGADALGSPTLEDSVSRILTPPPPGVP